MYNKSQKKSGLYKALAINPELIKEYVNQYTQGQLELPDELVEAFTQANGDVKKIEQMCNNLKKSKEGAQLMKVTEQVYAAAQKEIDAEINTGTGLFKDGGKFQYLYKLSKGKSVPNSQSYKNPKDFENQTLLILPTRYAVPNDRRYMPVDTTKNEESKKKEQWYKFLEQTDPKNSNVQKVQQQDKLYRDNNNPQQLYLDGGGNVGENGQQKEFNHRYRSHTGYSLTGSPKRTTYESARFPGKNFVSRWIEEVEGHPADTSVTVNNYPVKEEYWRFVNNEMDRVKREHEQSVVKKQEDGGIITPGQNKQYKGQNNWGFWHGNTHNFGNEGDLYEHGYTQEHPEHREQHDSWGYNLVWGQGSDPNRSVMMGDKNYGDAKHVRVDYHDNGRTVSYNDKWYGDRMYANTSKDDYRNISELPIEVQRKVWQMGYKFGKEGLPVVNREVPRPTLSINTTKLHK